MSMTINTNIMSLVAQSNLNKSQQQLNTAIERLSSGSKINSAKDNAAGEAIANRMTSQVNGLMQASSNANDGISLAQTTEGALDQVNNNLQHIRQLSVQAANGTNSSSDLQSIQDEINQRLGEINRVSSQTAFNGTKVLDGSKTSIDIQVGADDGQTISVKLQNVDAKSLGLGSFNIAGPASSGSVVDGSSTITVGGVTLDTSSTASASSTVATSIAVTNTGSASSVSLSSSVGSSTYVLVQDSNDNYFIQHGSGSTAEYYAATVTTGTDSSGNATMSVSFNSDKANGLATSNPLAALDSAINTVDDVRSGLGAVQNRLDSAISNINSTTTNLSSARSRITDADYATEVSSLSKAKILQQAGQSVLAQANQTNQGVITLLRSA